MTAEPDPNVPTSRAVSPDSGEHWAAEGAWAVADGVHRIPLPLPMDGLRAVNVYVVESEGGLTLVDGGWAIPVAREVLDRSLASMGAGFGDITRFLVTHSHRDHYTMARVIGTEVGAEVLLGEEERPALEVLDEPGGFPDDPFDAALRAAGADDVADLWQRREREEVDRTRWAGPDRWIAGDTTLDLGTRTFQAVHTPGHTPGHYVFADEGAGLLFAGDHVLPTITPSIGFTVPVPDQPLGDFMSSLARVLALPDLRLLPAHGPLAPSSHTRATALLAHHEDRLAAMLALLSPTDGRTARQVAGGVGWTRHLHPFDELDPFARGLASMETRAHLELLVARGQAVVTPATADAPASYVATGG
ncbi:MAG: MBL fold metallo-hydrolase [Nocardioides sp.]|nr:MBL fold metallo-hydrolase [Nocardioides sp.]